MVILWVNIQYIQEGGHQWCPIRSNGISTFSSNGEEDHWDLLTRKLNDNEDPILSLTRHSCHLPFNWEFSYFFLGSLDSSSLDWCQPLLLSAFFFCSILSETEMLLFLRRRRNIVTRKGRHRSSTLGMSHWSIKRRHLWRKEEGEKLKWCNNMNRDNKKTVRKQQQE
jgi:hypothetical protein